jgi:glycosyltransferase involved in cell wall biosynthesis
MERAAAVILPLERTSSPAAEATLISAMCYGKPVIITKTITTEEYITDGLDGLLVPWKNPDAILDAINFLFSNPEKAAEIGRRARQTVLTTHTMERYSKKIVDIIQSDLRGNSA